MAVNERQFIELDVSPAVAWQQLYPVFEGMAVALLPETPGPIRDHPRPSRLAGWW